MPNAYYFVELIQLKKRYLQQRHAVSDSINIAVYAYDVESVGLVAIAHKFHHLRKLNGRAYLKPIKGKYKQKIAA